MAQQGKGMAWQSDGGANRNHAADEQRMAAAGRINALTCSGMAVCSNAKAWQGRANRREGKAERFTARAFASTKTIARERYIECRK